MSLHIDCTLKILGKQFDYRHRGPKPYAAILTEIFHNGSLIFRSAFEAESWRGKPLKGIYAMQLVQPDGYVWRSGFGVLWWEGMYWDGGQWRSPYEIPDEIIDHYVKIRQHMPREEREQYRLSEDQIRARGWTKER